MSSKKKYYIAGRAFVPDEDILLCKGVVYGGDIMADTTMLLYVTRKGAYYQVTNSAGGEVVEILSEAAALKFMDKYAAGIDTDNYDSVFGEPERG